MISTIPPLQRKGPVGTESLAWVFFPSLGLYLSEIPLELLVATVKKLGRAVEYIDCIAGSKAGYASAIYPNLEDEGRPREFGMGRRCLWDSGAWNFYFHSQPPRNAFIKEAALSHQEEKSILPLKAGNVCLLPGLRARSTLNREKEQARDSELSSPACQEACLSRVFDLLVLASALFFAVINHLAGPGKTDPPAHKYQPRMG